MNGAWFGATDRVREHLCEVHADRDEEGQFVLEGDNGVVFGIGGDEVIVPDDVRYFIEGEPVFLALELAKNDGGIRVMVF